MKLLVFDSVDEMSRYAAEKTVQTIETNQRPVLGLPTGDTPLKLYQYLIDDHIHNHTDYSDVVTFNLDEYIGLDSKDYNSYHAYMQRHLFRHLNIPLENTFIPKGNGIPLSKAIEDYESALEKHPIDLQILGIGANGHIGFNEPGTSFESTTHVIELDPITKENNKKHFPSRAKVPNKAITMGIHSILQAKEIMLLASGTNKAEAVQSMVEAPPTTECPASALKLHNKVTVLLDKEAAKLLKEEHPC